MESREALRICSQALPGRDTGRTDLDGMKPLSRQGAEQRDLLPLPHGECGVRGKAPKNGSRDWSLVGSEGKAHALLKHNSIYGENTGQILETRALRQE